MNAPEDAPQGEATAPEAGFEELLARCIDARGAGDRPLLERLLAGSPQQAGRVRERLDALEGLGLLQVEPAAPVRVAGHRIVAELGRGGMGAVYLAEEEASGRSVALKLAGLAHEAGEEGRRARARFEREIQAVAQLDHPRIVAIRASGEHEGRPWFTMDGVRGVTLARVVERLRARGRPPEDLSAAEARSALLAELEAIPVAGVAAGLADLAEGNESAAWSTSYVAWCCHVVIDIAAALEHAHAHGVVHRDVKPSNVLVTPDGHALLFDFGLALVRDHPTITRSGDFAGTPYAVAPEQVDARRGEVGPRTDVWGLGVVLYELLTLRRPFDAQGPAALLRRVLEDDPLPPRRLQPRLPHALENVCATAMEKDPRRRYASAAELRADLERFLAGRTVRARGASPTRRTARFVRRRPGAAVALALTGLIAVGVPLGLLAANAVVRGHARRAERAATEAQRLADANAEVVGYLVDLFEPLEAGPADAEALARLEAQAQRLEVDLGRQPLARAALLEASGTVFANLGEVDRARPLYDRALAIRQSELGEGHPDTVALLGRLARVCVESGEPQAALGLCRRALDAIAGGDAEQTAQAARLRATAARALADTGRNDEAARELERLRAGLQGPAQLDEETLAEVLEELARVESALGRTDEALARCEEALALRRASWLPEPRALARTLDLSAELRAAAGDDAGQAAARAEAGALRAALRADADPLPLPAELVLHDPGGPAYEEAFQAGITALQARRLDEASASFERCLQLQPARAVCMYNLACAHALSGDAAGALDWLERAARAGFGLLDDQLELVQRDADLATLRGERRFAALAADLAARGAELAARTREPQLRFPSGLDGARRAPVLLVLHADGSSKEAVVHGPWARVAEELGCILVAPSAPRPLGLEAEQGLAWTEDVDDFARRPWDVEASSAAALADVLGRSDVERGQVLVAGEGSGALVAFDLALRAPGLVRGVLLVNGPALLEVPASRLRTAAALGLQVAARVDASGSIPWIAPGLGAEAYASSLARWLAWNDLAQEPGEVELVLPADPDERAANLIETLQRLSR